MTTALRFLTFIVLLGMAAIAMAHPSQADGRRDWSGYAWQSYEISDCVSTGAELSCPPYHQKWDWKRNQWVDIAVTIDLKSNRLLLSQTLTDSDWYDDDDVCVTALVLNGDGENLVAHHQNWRIAHGEVASANFTYTSHYLATATVVHIGSKQCRKGAAEDDALYALVLSRIQP